MHPSPVVLLPPPRLRVERSLPVLSPSPPSSPLLVVLLLTQWLWLLEEVDLVVVAVAGGI
jgi:hypothetical protein